MSTDQVINSDLDYDMLDRELSRTKARVFMDPKYAGFLGTILCSMNFMWVSDIPTAQTNGTTLKWNPYWFLSLPPKTRVTVLVHELWHTARLDHYRLLFPGMDPRIRNIAMDYKINNDLDDQGYSFEGTDPWLDHQYDSYSTEELYDHLMKKSQDDWDDFIKQMMKDGFNEPDLIDPDEEDPTIDDKDKGSLEDILTIVNQAVHASVAAGDAGDVPGEIKTILKRFLKPKISWGTKLHRFFTGIGEEQFNFVPPNRSYPDHYLPSEEEGDGIAKLTYFKDISLSVTDSMVLRFNSELKYVKEVYNPKIMEIVQFDTMIQKIDILTEEDPFDEIEIHGRGGTSLKCVHDYIVEHKPTAVIVFSDLQCTPMEKIDGVPIIWVCLNNLGARVNQGEVIHLRE